MLHSIHHAHRIRGICILLDPYQGADPADADRMDIHSKFVFLIVVNVFLLLVGMFIEGNASMIILVPLLAPIAAEYGINEIQFAMIYIFNNAIGALSPPMGTLMFVTCSITKCKTAAFIKEAVPFYILLVVNLMLLTWFEPFTTFLVNLFY